jgi:transcriptional regulator with XRE-family HTH domain
VSEVHLVKKLRTEKGFTQQELANAIGRDRTLINKIERNKAGVSIPVAKALGKALGVEWPVFFDDEGEDSSH